MEGCVIGLDVGDVRVGIAVSDATRLIASPLEVLQRRGWGPDARYIAELCRRYDTREVVSGLPLNMDGTEGFQAQKVKQFCAQLEKQGLTVYYQDERLTTVTAENALREGGVYRQERRRQVDKVAAAVILQTWLDARRASGPEPVRPAAWRRKNVMDETFETPMEGEEMDSLVELVDEDGNTVAFEHLATVEYEGDYYICLAEPETDEADSTETEVVIMRIEEDENGEEIYAAIEDEDLLDAVYEKFIDMMEDEDSPEQDGEGA
nr:Putative Holliday junction resolvase YggF [uncultured bacterium]